MLFRSVIGKAEVVVGAEIDVLATVYCHQGLLRGAKHALGLEQAGSTQFVGLR